MRIEPKLVLNNVGADDFYTDYAYWVRSRGLYKSPTEQALAESIKELVEYAQVSAWEDDSHASNDSQWLAMALNGSQWLRLILDSYNPPVSLLPNHSLQLGLHGFGE